MASLRFREKILLEEFLEMGSGYVLNFSDRTFADFFRHFDIEIDDAPYLEGHSGSKANRMRSFWDREPDRLVGRVLQELIEYAESYRPGHPGSDGCRAIATRLLAKQPLRVTAPQSASARAQQGSPHFLASRYCYEIEGEIALRRHREGTARVIPVVLRACDWTVTPFGELQGLPRDGIPITQWPDRDQASLDVARGIMDSILESPAGDS
jgi:hypothetical protein